MPQNTNLNTFPYFDDFDESKKYHKVLFKPGQPVQARELTTIQSILGNQIEKFGDHIFKEGSVVIPGSLSVTSDHAVYELGESYNGLDVAEYIKSFIGKVIIGEISGVKAKIEHVEGYHIFVNIIAAGGDNETEVFFADEPLITQDTVALTDTAITSLNAGASIALIKGEKSGCIAKITDGIFYLRGNFVNVDEQTLAVSVDDPRPSFKLGFDVKESLVSAYDDETLYDNSQGFVNYAAPGADRLKLDPVLTAVISGPVPQNFIEIARVVNGQVTKSKVDNPEYNILADELARRTFDESGNYYVKPFSLDVKNSLQDFLGSDGVFEAGEPTATGQVAREEIGCYVISAGKAYVQGYECNIPTSVITDFNKTRETKTLKNQGIEYLTGRTSTTKIHIICSKC